MKNKNKNKNKKAYHDNNKIIINCCINDKLMFGHPNWFLHQTFSFTNKYTLNPINHMFYIYNNTNFLSWSNNLGYIIRNNVIMIIFSNQKMCNTVYYYFKTCWKSVCSKKKAKNKTIDI